ncbi:MAG: tRNA lysidine(34) synthetase TilS [Balneolaceae bacterium]|nr:tRNA lysidine(34) synthetase TilS [Balneolaceae bacterium]
MSRSGLLPIESRVKKHLEKNFTDVQNTRIIAGISGGPDSMAMLHIFRQLQLPVVAVHVNYQKRGEEAEKDQALAKNKAEAWGCRFYSFRLDPADAEGNNFQQWARRRRYAIFREQMKRHDGSAIAVAHHRDDQIETILQKLFRGAGLASWRAMDIWDPPLFRPLLDTARQEIMTYLDTCDIPWRRDESNLKSEFARNLLRNEWLERLEDFFPGWEDNVLRISEQAEMFTAALEHIAGELTDARDRIDLDRFSSLDSTLQKAVVLHLLKKRDPGIEITTGALQQVDEIPSLQTGQSIQLSSRYSLLNDRRKLKIVYEQFDDMGAITLRREKLEDAPFRFNDLQFRLEAFPADPDYDEALFLDAGSLAWPLVLRRWRAGDAFQPFGMTGHQKVADHLTNRKISAAEKKRALVLETFEETICAVIFPPIEKRNPPGTISDPAKCDRNTTKCLVIGWNR